MNRTITVRGTGRVSLRPDTVVVSMTLTTLDKDYDRSMSLSAGLLDGLRAALADIGFEEKELKTTHFNVSARHDSVRDENGSYKSVFMGYSCTHGLKLEFALDTALLSRVLSAVSRSIADPELNIRFTVSDPDAAADELLASAAANARHKADVLAAASGAALGQLVTIDYNWGELNVYSRTEYGMDRKCMAMASPANMSFEPEDIDLSDSAAFVWELL